MSNTEIRTFRSKRGRPRQHDAPRGPDLGTPELAMKRALGQTSESIDICLERKLITPEQHGCALHLRWLHTIRYGAPGITALDLTRGPGQELYDEDDPRWRIYRERDYHEAIELLRERGYAQELLPCIIYNERPDFIHHSLYQEAFTNPKLVDQLHRQIARFAEGLELLRELWRR